MREQPLHFEYERRIDELEDAIDANDKYLQEVEVLNAELLAAMKKYTRRGHHDTCSHALSMEYACDCGFVEGRAAIAKAEAMK